MKNEAKENFGPAIVFTLQALDILKARGFRYVRVNAFTRDKRLDYMEPHYFVLVPVKDLQDDPDKKGIYEPIDSQVLTDWAHFPNEGIKVLVTMG
jgi:hypothetical protein